MISIVVPVWRKDVYERVCKPWVTDQAERFGAQIIEVSGHDSIFESHEHGRQQAIHDVILYVHDDVKLIEPVDLTPAVIKAFEGNQKLGLIGPCGRGTIPKIIPWWLNRGGFVGHYVNRNKGSLAYRYGHNGSMKMTRTDKPLQVPNRWNKWSDVALVDGFYLMEHKARLNASWDTETYKGHWHGYDADRCLQARELGLEVKVPPWLFMHDNGGHAGYKGTDTAHAPRKDSKDRKAFNDGDELWLSDLDDVNEMVKQKWGL